MGGWWVQELYGAGRVPELISWIFWVIFSITLHELAHGWAAIWQGDRTPIEQQRMTMNPWVHMGPLSLLVFAIVGIAWGVMPVDPSRYRWRRRGRIVVSGAGPAMNILLAIISLTLLVVWMKFGPSDSRPDLYRNLSVFFWTGGWMNIVLALLNLLPVPPLDGSHILSGISFKCYQFFQRPQVQMYGVFALLIVLIMFGLIGHIIEAGHSASLFYVELLGGWLDTPDVWEALD